MKLLAIDTSANLCAACIYDVDTDNVLASETRDIGRGHAEVLMELIEGVLNSSYTSYAELSKIAVTCGPGSFAGVRVGLATVRGLRLALNIPAVSMSTLDGLAQVAKDDVVPIQILSMIDAGRGEAYYQFFQADGKSSNCQPQVAAYETIAGIIGDSTIKLCGSASDQVNQLLEQPLPVSHRLTAVPVEILAQSAAKGSLEDTALDPVYVRPPDAKPQTGFAVPRV